MITVQDLDKLVEKYEIKEFIFDDPIQFPHRFKTPSDIEIAGFLSALFAYGKREQFIKKLDTLFNLMQNEPLNFVLNFDEKILNGFNYRFAKTNDIAEILYILNQLYKKDGGLCELFKFGYSDKNILQMLKVVTDYFYSRTSKKASTGFYHMLCNPNNGGAMKRLNMYLRWLVRKSQVDLGIWNFIDKKDLLIPLDVHVARISRQLNLLNRSSNDFKSVLELTNKLKEFDETDPVKYDFALFGYGIDLTKINK